MSDAESECQSGVDSFPLLHSSVKIGLKVKTDVNVEIFHLRNRRQLSKTKWNLSKAMDQNKPSPRVSPGGALKQGDDFVIEFDSDLTKFNENLNVFSKVMFDLLGTFAESQNHTTINVKEIT